LKGKLFNLNKSALVGKKRRMVGMLREGENAQTRLIEVKN